MAERLANFRGAVHCERASPVPGLLLSGTTAEPSAERIALAFSGAAAVELPDTLEEVAVEQVSAGQYRISARSGSWLVSAAAVHLHREIAAQFYAAIPPRPVPWAKRVFWRAVLALAATPAGLAVLKALRR